MKPVKMSGGKSDRTVFKKGPDPRRGRGPKKGAPNAGRPPDVFKALCQQLACDGAKVAPRILSNPDHPAYLGALKWASEHGYGRPEQSVDLTSKGGPLAVVVSIVREGKKVTSG